MAAFVATVPLLWVFRILTGLPKPLARSHRQWPVSLNLSLIGLITANVTVFIYGIYGDGPADPPGFMLRFLIAAVVYLFGFVLLVRQFEGLYPEYFVTTGRTGLGLRKALYRNITDIDEAPTSKNETRLRIQMRTGETLHLTLPRRDVPAFHKAIEDNQVEL